MSKGCRDPSDLILKRRIFSPNKCECDCENQEITSFPMGSGQCTNCLHVQTILKPKLTGVSNNDRMSYETFAELINFLSKIKIDFKLELGIFQGGTIGHIETEKSARETIEKIKSKLALVQTTSQGVGS